MLGKINWKPSTREIRIFGGIFLVGFAVIAAVLAMRGKAQAARVVMGVAGAVGILSMAVPPLGAIFYRVWMAIGFCIGFVVSKMILVILFYFVFTPVALVFKIVRRDSLALKRAAAPTYWKDHPAIVDKEDYTHLF